MDPEATMTVCVRQPTADLAQPPRVLAVTISTVCPECGGPRGTPRARVRARGGFAYEVDEWRNACGHVDFYGAVIKEGKGL